MNTQRKGKKGEALAKVFLLNKGYTVLAENFRSPWGEIDLIAREDRFLVFVEVRSRNKDGLGKPEETITYPKQRRLVKTARAYLAKHPTKLETRFDVVSIVWDEQAKPHCSLFQDAFLPG